MKLAYCTKDEFYEFTKNLIGYHAGTQEIYKDDQGQTIAVTYNTSNPKYCISQSEEK